MLTKKEDIIDWLEEEIQCTNYTVLENEQHGYIVNIHENFSMAGMKYKKFPVKFNVIDGNFSCANCSLESLIGAPKIVNGYFEACANNIVSLEHCPEVIVGDCYFTQNKINDLLFFPQKASRIFLDSKVLGVSVLSQEQKYLLDTREFESLYKEHKKQVINHLKQKLEEIIPHNKVDIKMSKI